ncbi:RluA family pseudouridine synthase [Campylobacter sp. JMF_02 ED1]|uniref:RluA family pseudouridine synthase n=1 Tax=unclassified Campylobacter TaxID=2593542 RepID=UPI0022E9D68B|nr:MULTISPECIES: RluA family pseudouridine synthase [unclassified Campylobacter]MDA3048925.1 RluA family pseudouridine synthase [Campylobacter sp. JMF_15 NE4]MDA3050364.1 RluA family pseudouridine synthase [Campylobacter sp. JMF_02 ED1]
MDNFTADCVARIDVFLSENLGISRNQISNLIKSGSVFINQKIITKSSQKLNLGDEICVNYPAPTHSDEAKFSFEGEIEILYEDDDLLVLNKPAGVVVHPAPSVKEATIVEWLRQKGFMLSTINGQIRAGIVHRLDKGTSGALVVAKNNATHQALSAQLSDKSMGRIYLALTDLPLKEPCVIDRPIDRNPNNRLKKAIIPGGREAKSAFYTIFSDDWGQAKFSQSSSDKFGKINLIAAKLFTGRTHQIRVHLGSINRHIIGDYLYGFKSEKDKIARILLHAYVLYFTHPRSGERMQITAPLPVEFDNLIQNHDKKDEIYEKILPSSILREFSDTSGWLLLS